MLRMIDATNRESGLGAQPMATKACAQCGRLRPEDSTLAMCATCAPSVEQTAAHHRPQAVAVEIFEEMANASDTRPMTVVRVIDVSCGMWFSAKDRVEACRQCRGDYIFKKMNY